MRMICFYHNHTDPIVTTVAFCVGANLHPEETHNPAHVPYDDPKFMRETKIVQSDPEEIGEHLRSHLKSRLG